MRIESHIGKSLLAKPESNIPALRYQSNSSNPIPTLRFQSNNSSPIPALRFQSNNSSPIPALRFQSNNGNPIGRDEYWIEVFIPAGVLACETRASCGVERRGIRARRPIRRTPAIAKLEHKLCCDSHHSASMYEVLNSQDAGHAIPHHRQVKFTDGWGKNAIANLITAKVKLLQPGRRKASITLA